MVFVPILAPNVALLVVFKVDVVMLCAITPFRVLVPLTFKEAVPMFAPKVALLVMFKVSKLPEPVTRRLAAAKFEPKVAAPETFKV